MNLQPPDLKYNSRPLRYAQSAEDESSPSQSPVRHHSLSHPTLHAPCLTCVLSKLVHGLEVYDVGRQAVVDLTQNNAATPGIVPYHCLNVVAHGWAVRPPPSVLVEPFPDDHSGGEQHAGPVKRVNTVAFVRCLVRRNAV